MIWTFGALALVNFAVGNTILGFSCLLVQLGCLVGSVLELISDGRDDE